MGFFSFVLISCLWAKPIELPTIEVDGDDYSKDITRSINWPTTSQPVTPAIQLPQLDDALNASDGVQVRTQGSPTLSIRGSAQSGRALVLYDHIPLNFATGFGAPRIFLPKENLQRIKVVKGPGSLFYGSQAMAGAVDFISKKFERPEFNVNFSDTNESFLPWRQGSLAHQSYHMATPLLSSSSTHLQSSAFYEDDDGAFPFQNANASGERDFNASNLSRVTLQGSHSAENWSLQFNSLLGRQILQSPGAITFPLPTRQETEGLLVSLTPQIFFSDSSSLKSRLSFLSSESDFLENSNADFTNQQTLIFQNEWVYDFGKNNQLQFFADAFFHELDTSFVGQGLQQGNSEAGPFVSFQIFENWTHQVGGRYLFQQQEFLPSASTHFYFSRYDTWLSFSEGFRNPSLTDLFSNSPFFVGNADLMPEKSQQWEWGVTTQPSERWQWDVRVFHMAYRNFIESFEITPGVFSRANLGEGRAQGVDISSSWRGRWIQPSLTYNYLDTQSRQQQRAFRLSPRHQLTAGALVQFSSFQFQVQNVHWYDTIDVSGNQAVDLEDWQQWNFFFQFLQKDGFRLSLGLINAFDEGKQLTLNYPEPQRKYWLQLHQEI